MSVEDRGFLALYPVPTSKLGPLDRAYRAIERGSGAGILGACVAAAAFHTAGVSRVVATVGAVGMGTFCAKLGGKLPDPKSAASQGIDLQRIHLSLNVGEVVLFPLAAGLALALSSDTSRKRDAAALLVTAALGAGATTAVLVNRRAES